MPINRGLNRLTAAQLDKHLHFGMLTLHELDDLTLRVRSPDVRTYFAEAVRALRAGALRSAVLSLWVAVNYDVIEKLRELAAAADPQAVADVLALEGWITRNDTRALQTFETNVLQQVRDRYGLLAQFELDDLNRLKQDRNRCAHPAFTPDGRLYEPSPEQVRAHMVNAVHHLLAHPPVQGKSVLNRLQAEVTGSAFPDEAAQVALYVGPKYLDRGKASLVGGIVNLFLKEALAATPTVPRSRSLHVLAAVKGRRHDLYWQGLERLLPRLVSALSSTELPQVLDLLVMDPDAWSLLPSEEHVRLRATVSQAPPEAAESVLLPALNTAPLHALARTRLAALSGDIILPLVLAHPSVTLGSIVVDRLVGAATYREAWQFAGALQAVLGFVTEQDVRQVIVAARTNSQIHSAGNMPGRLRRLLRSTAGTWPGLQPEWVDLVEERQELISVIHELQALGWVPAPAEV